MKLLIATICILQMHLNLASAKCTQSLPPGIVTLHELPNNDETINPCKWVPNSTYMQSVSSTEATCENPTPTGTTDDLINTCVCNPGYVKNHWNQCVTLAECPNCDDPNSAFKQCAGPLVSCQNPTPPQFIAAICISRCQCNKGYIYDEIKNICVSKC